MLFAVYTLLFISAWRSVRSVCSEPRPAPYSGAYAAAHPAKANEGQEQ